MLDIMRVIARALFSQLMAPSLCSRSLAAPLLLLAILSLLFPLSLPSFLYAAASFCDSSLALASVPSGVDEFCRNHVINLESCRRGTSLCILFFDVCVSVLSSPPCAFYFLFNYYFVSSLFNALFLYRPARSHPLCQSARLLIIGRV